MGKKKAKGQGKVKKQAKKLVDDAKEYAMLRIMMDQVEIGIRNARHIPPGDWFNDDVMSPETVQRLMDTAKPMMAQQLSPFLQNMEALTTKYADVPQWDPTVIRLAQQPDIQAAGAHAADELVEHTKTRLQAAFASAGADPRVVQGRENIARLRAERETLLADQAGREAQLAEIQQRVAAARAAARPAAETIDPLPTPEAADPPLPNTSPMTMDELEAEDMHSAPGALNEDEPGSTVSLANQDANIPWQSARVTYSGDAYTAPDPEHAAREVREAATEQVNKPTWYQHHGGHHQHPEIPDEENPDVVD